MEGLMGAIAPKPAGQPPQQGWNPGNIQQRPGWNNRELQWTPDGQPICFGCYQVGHLNRDCPTTPRRRSRTEDGKIICFGCNEVGHTRPFCPKYQQQGRALGQWQENMGNQLMVLVGSGGSQQEGTLPILKIDVKRMVTQEVLCGDKRVSAVIYTVAVCSSNLAEELKLVITPWRKNRLVAIDGKEITPGGAAWLSVSDGVTKVEGGGS